MKLRREREREDVIEGSNARRFGEEVVKGFLRFYTVAVREKMIYLIRLTVCPSRRALSKRRDANFIFSSNGEIEKSQNAKRRRDMYSNL